MGRSLSAEVRYEGDEPHDGRGLRERCTWQQHSLRRSLALATCFTHCTCLIHCTFLLVALALLIAVVLLTALALLTGLVLLDGALSGAGLAAVTQHLGPDGADSRLVTSARRPVWGLLQHWWQLLPFGECLSAV